MIDRLVASFFQFLFEQYFMLTINKYIIGVENNRIESRSR